MAAFVLIILTLASPTASTTAYFQNADQCQQARIDILAAMPIGSVVVLCELRGVEVTDSNGRN